MNEIRALSPRARASVAQLGTLAEWLTQHPSQSGDTLTRPHPLLLLVRRAGFLVLIAPASVWDNGRDLLSPYLDKFAAIEARLVLLGRPTDPDLSQALNLGLCALLAEAPAPEEVFVALHQAFELMDVKARSESRGKWLNRYRYELGELIEIARALTTEREIDKLLNLILEKARFICAADAGSMYVVDGDDPVLARRQLHFKLSQNDSVSFDSREFAMPISTRSMAGYVALEQKTLRIDDVYDMPAGSPFGFDRSFDQKVGYRTRSMLVTPLITSKGEVIGVLQLINKKREPKQKLLSADDFERGVVPFDERSEQLVATLAAQAGIALENAILYQEIRKIFEGFVKASVDAIRSARPDYQRSFAACRRPDRQLGGRGRAHGYRAVPRGPLATRRSARNRIRLGAARLRQDRRAGTRAGQSQEALPARGRLDSAALRVRDSDDRGRNHPAQNASHEPRRRSRRAGRARSRACGKAR
ncbi:MAG: GAF domain-containing protein [Pseudomonadota bacterium]